MTLSFAGPASRPAPLPNPQTSASAARPAAQAPVVSIRLTGMGLLAMPMTATVLLAALNSEVNLMYLAVGLAIMAVVVNTVMLSRSLSGLTVTRRLPESATADQPLDVTLEVANTSRWWGAYALSIEDRLNAEIRSGLTVGVASHVPPGQREPCPYRMVPARRGRLVFGPIAVRSRFPFGMLQRKAIHHAPDELLVWPARGQLLGDVLSAARRGRPQRAAVAAQRGTEEDFAGLRDYRPGDNPRLIHWRSSARRGRLILRELESRAAGRLVLVVDLRGERPPSTSLWNGAPRPALPPAISPRGETAVSFAATVIDQALTGGLAVGLAVLAPCDGPTDRQQTLPTAPNTPASSVSLLLAPAVSLSWLPIGLGGDHRRRLLDALALIGQPHSSPDDAAENPQGLAGQFAPPGIAAARSALASESLRGASLADLPTSLIAGAAVLVVGPAPPPETATTSAGEPDNVAGLARLACHWRTLTVGTPEFAAIFRAPHGNLAP